MSSTRGRTLATIILLLAGAGTRAEEGATPRRPVGPDAPAHTAPPGAAFEPGIDVYGRPVPPADLAPVGPRLPRGSRLRLRVRLAPPAGPRGVLPELEIGAVPPPPAGGP